MTLSLCVGKSQRALGGLVRLELCVSRLSRERKLTNRESEELTFWEKGNCQHRKRGRILSGLIILPVDYMDRFICRLSKTVFVQMPEVNLDSKSIVPFPNGNHYRTDTSC